jgi:ABC-type transport system involved in multi-copper enzyme maturation permease subunit
VEETTVPERRSFFTRLVDLLDDPILLLQLRGAFRRKRFFWLQTGLLTLLAAITLIYMWSVTEKFKDNTSEVGRQTFLVFTAAELLLVFFVFPAFSCTAITDERTNKSLDLLLTTRLTPERIVFGKTLAAFVYGLLFIVATLPLVALTFLFGGVSPGQIALTYGVLATVALVVTLFALSVSSAMGSTLRSVLATYVGLFLIVLPTIAPLIDSSFVLDPFFTKRWPSADSASGILTVHVFGPLVHQAEAVAIRDAIRAYDPLETVLYWGTHAAFYVCLASFFFLIARHRLAPTGTNRSTPFRVWFLATVGVGLAGALVGLSHESWEPRSLLTLLLETDLPVVAALVVGAVAFAAEDPAVPKRVRASTERHKGPRAPLRMLYPGARQGERFILWMAFLTQVAVVAIFLGVLAVDGAKGETGQRDGLHVLEWGTTWTFAFIFFLVELAVLLTCEIRHAAQTRLWVVVYLVFATLYPVFWFYVDDPSAKARLYEGYFLSPWTVFDSLLFPDTGAKRQLVLFGPSGREIREAKGALDRRLDELEKSEDGRYRLPIATPDPELTRRELLAKKDAQVSETVIRKTLAHLDDTLARLGPGLAEAQRGSDRGANEAILLNRIRSEAHAELERDLVREGVPVHEVSTVIYAVLALVLWAMNRRRLARAENEDANLRRLPPPELATSSEGAATSVPAPEPATQLAGGEIQASAPPASAS